MCSSAFSPVPMQVAAAMFTPASLIAAATCASAPAVFSMSMTRSNAMAPPPVAAYSAPPSSLASGVGWVRGDHDEGLIEADPRAERVDVRGARGGRPGARLLAQLDARQARGVSRRAGRVLEDGRGQRGVERRALEHGPPDHHGRR